MLDDLISLPDAISLLPRRSGRPVHIKTVRRWVAKGLKRHGQFVKLGSERIGGRIFTSTEWIEEFIAGCSANTQEQRAIRSSRTVGEAAAERFLMSEGFYGKAAQAAFFGREPRKRKRGSPFVSATIP